jgi:hypothetical protein
MENISTQVTQDLDKSIIQLAEIFKKIGVEELTITDHYQHHIIDRQSGADPDVVNNFCLNIRQLYNKIVVPRNAQ